MTSRNQAETFPTEDKGGRWCIRMLIWVILSNVPTVKNGRENYAALGWVMGPLWAWGNMSRCGAVQATQSQKKISAHIFSMLWSACCCPSLKPVRVDHFPASYLQRRYWSSVVSKWRSRPPPTRCCTLRPRSPKKLPSISSLTGWRGILSWQRLAYFLGAFFIIFIQAYRGPHDARKCNSTCCLLQK